MKFNSENNGITRMYDPVALSLLPSDNVHKNFGELAPPRSRWVGANERRLPKHEEAGIYEAVDRLYSAKVGCATVHSQSRRREPDAAQYSLAEMTDVELDFAIFGVTVE